MRALITKTNQCKDDTIIAGEAAALIRCTYLKQSTPKHYAHPTFTMDSLHLLVLIFLQHVISHSCRGLDPTPRAELAEDDDDLRNILHVVPFLASHKWRSNYSRTLPSIRKDHAPIAIILAPSNIAAKFRDKRIKALTSAKDDIPDETPNSNHEESHPGHSMENSLEEEYSSNLDTADSEDLMGLNKINSKEDIVLHNSAEDDKNEQSGLKVVDLSSQDYTNLIVEKDKFAETGIRDHETVDDHVIERDTHDRQDVKKDHLVEEFENKMEFDAPNVVSSEEHSKSHRIHIPNHSLESHFNKNYDEDHTDIKLEDHYKNTLSVEENPIAASVDVLSNDSTSTEHEHEDVSQAKKKDFFKLLNFECVKSESSVGSLGGRGTGKANVFNFLFHIHA